MLTFLWVKYDFKVHRNPNFWPNQNLDLWTTFVLVFFITWLVLETKKLIIHKTYNQVFRITDLC